MSVFASELEAVRWAASAFLHGDAGHEFIDDHFEQMLREVAGALGVHPADVEALPDERGNFNDERYAMHYGIPYRLLSQDELDAVDRAVKRFGGDAYQDGDNAFEWGEPIMDAEEIKACGWDSADFDADDRRAAQSGHLVIYINKGHYPEDVHHHVVRALPLVTFLPHYNFDGTGLPFAVDEAEEWGKNVDTAWQVWA